MEDQCQSIGIGFRSWFVWFRLGPILKNDYLAQAFKKDLVYKRQDHESH